MPAKGPSKKPRTVTAIRFPEELHDKLREAAQSYGLPLNFLVIKAIEDFLDRMIPPSEFRLTRDHSVPDKHQPSDD